MADNPKRKAAFIDRDGTLIEEVNFLSRTEDLRLFSFTEEAVRLLKYAGFLVVVITNQSGIGRGLYTEGDMHSIHRSIQDQLNGAIDGFYFCPHLPDAGCCCRKPKLKMIESACSELGIELNGSWMIGDKKLDVETGINAGIRTAMVMTGYGKEHFNKLTDKPDIAADDLLAVANRIIESRDLSQ